MVSKYGKYGKYAYWTTLHSPVNFRWVRICELLTPNISKSLDERPGKVYKHNA